MRNEYILDNIKEYSLFFILTIHYSLCHICFNHKKTKQRKKKCSQGDSRISVVYACSVLPVHTVHWLAVERANQLMSLPMSN